MAGAPKRRIKALTTALRANGIDPDALLTAAPAPLRDAASPHVATAGMEDLNAASSRAYARERQIPTTARAAIGPQTRSTADQLAANDLSRIAALLEPGLTVRIERTRPTWAAGWVEDLLIDDHDLGAVLDYLSTEHGGQMYRATVIDSNGAQLYTARIPIAGPPRQLGRVKTRGQWDGTAEQTAAAVVHQPAPAAGFDLKAMVDLMGMLQGQNQERQDTLIQSVREMNASNQNTTNAMLKALMAQREEGKQPGLREQLRELVQASQAIEEVREVFGASNNDAPSNAKNDDGDFMQGVLKSAAADIIKQGFKNDQERAPATPMHAQPPPGFRRVQQQPRQQHRPPQQQPAPSAPAQPKAPQQ